VASGELADCEDKWLEFAAGFAQWRAEFVLREFFGEPRQCGDGGEIVWFRLGI
jgi:hypothetical protein